jgi:hypothetical protein
VLSPPLTVSHRPLPQLGQGGRCFPSMGAWVSLSATIAAACRSSMALRSSGDSARCPTSGSATVTTYGACSSIRVLSRNVRGLSAVVTEQPARLDPSVRPTALDADHQDASSWAARTAAEGATTSKSSFHRSVSRHSTKSQANVAHIGQRRGRSTATALYPHRPQRSSKLATGRTIGADGAGAAADSPTARLGKLWGDIPEASTLIRRPPPRRSSETCR